MCIAYCIVFQCSFDVHSMFNCLCICQIFFITSYIYKEKIYNKIETPLFLHCCCFFYKVLWQFEEFFFSRLQTYCLKVEIYKPKEVYLYLYLYLYIYNYIHNIYTNIRVSRLFETCSYFISLSTMGKKK